MAIVLDSSMAMALFMDDEAVSEADGILIALDVEPAVVPELWLYEVANSVLVAARRGRIPQSECPVRLALILGLAVNLENGNAGSIAGPTLTLAVTHNLTIYDASYLELATRRSLPLATLDRKLAQAARAEGVEVIGG